MLYITPLITSREQLYRCMPKYILVYTFDLYISNISIPSVWLMDSCVANTYSVNYTYKEIEGEENRLY